MIPRRSFNVLSISSILMDTSSSLGLRGEVVAAYDHSCYVQMNDGRTICIADASLDDGPITVRVALPRHLDFKALGIRLGMPLRMEGKDWVLGDEILLRTSGATPWAPPAISGFASPATVLRRLRTVRHHLERDVPETGLAPLVRHVEDLALGGPIIRDGVGDLARIGSQRVTCLVEGVRKRDARRIDEAVRGLIGLGPGLTPSGDDLLAGFMIGLIATTGPWDPAPETHPGEPILRQGSEAVAAILAQSILGHAANGTTRISNALLGHAVHGVGNDSVHRLLLALLQNEGAPEPTGAALKMTRTGHTSGWDCLAGILLGIHLGIRLSGTATAGRDGFVKLKTAV